MSGHSTASLGARHAPHNWEYADATVRAAATGFVSADLYKIALQLDDFSSWKLVATTPTWQAEGAGAGFSATTPADELQAGEFAADGGSNDTYVIALSPPITAYVTGAHYRFMANTANTGAATIEINSLGAKAIKKVAGGITTALATNDIRVGQWVDLVYDGTNMQMQSTLGNAPASSATTEGTSTATGTQNDFAHGDVTLLRMNNATATTITGFVAGTAGQKLTVVSIGAGQVNFAHQSGSSTAANAIINQVANTISLAAGSGTATFQYDATTQRWRVIDHMQGDVIQTTFSAGFYTASGSMAWGVDMADQVTYTYCLVGKLLHVFFQIDSTTVGGTPSTALQIQIPGGFTATWGQYVPCHVIDNATPAIGVAQVVASGTTVYVYRSPAAPNWTANTNDTSVRVSMTIPV